MVSQAQPQEYPFVDESFDTQSDSFVQSGINENALKKYVKDISKHLLLKRADEQNLGLKIELGRYIKKLYDELLLSKRSLNDLPSQYGWYTPFVM